MKRRWTGGCALLLSLLMGCGGEVRRTASEELLEREPTREEGVNTSSTDAIGATRVGLAAFVRMLDEEAMRRAPRSFARSGARAVDERIPSSPDARAQALAELWQGVIEAHEGAAYSDEQLAFAAHAGAAVVARETLALDEDDAKDARAGVERVRARVVVRSVERRFSALTGRAELHAALMDAGARLEDEVDAALSAGGDALEARLSEAWTRYIDDTEQLLEAVLATRGPIALAAVQRLRAFVSWEAEGLSLSAQDSGGGEAALDVVVEGLGGFYASICSAGTASQLDAAGLTPGEADAALAILANLYAAAV